MLLGSSSRFVRSLLAVTVFTFAVNALATEKPGSKSLLPAEAGLPSELSGLLLPVRELPENTLTLTGMAFEVPESAAQGQLVVMATRGKRALAQETIALPRAQTSTITSQFLGNHPEELAKIRKIDAVHPGALRFIVTSGGSVLIDVPFTSADLEAFVLATRIANVSGQTQLVKIDIPEPRVRPEGMVPSPACVSACEETFNICLFELCDQRGSCEYCYQDFEYCTDSCPQVCVEPKSVTTVYGTWGNYQVTDTSWWCYSSTAVLIETKTRQRAVYQRTTHCDNTYTDVFASYETQQSYCRKAVGGSCGFFPVWTDNLPVC